MCTYTAPGHSVIDHSQIFIFKTKANTPGASEVIKSSLAIREYKIIGEASTTQALSKMNFLHQLIKSHLINRKTSAS